MQASQVTVVDQAGRLLSAPNADSDLAVRDKMFEFAHRLEESYAQRIQEMLTPLVGPGRVRAQVVAQVDMATTEQTREQYNPQSQVVRSESVAEEAARNGANAAGGVPGALTNQPPQPGVALPPGASPAVAQSGANPPGAAAAPPAPRLTTRIPPRSPVRIPPRASRRATTRSTAPWPTRASPRAASRACRWPCSSTTCAPRTRKARSPKRRCPPTRSSASPRWCATPWASMPRAATRSTWSIPRSSAHAGRGRGRARVRAALGEGLGADPGQGAGRACIVLLIIIFSVLKPLTRGLHQRREGAGAAPGCAGRGRGRRRRPSAGRRKRRRSPTNSRSRRRAAWSRPDPKRGAQVVKSWVSNDE